MKKNLFSVMLFLVMFSQSAFAVVPEVVFNDLDGSNMFFTSVSWLKENGVVVGYEDGTYQPAKNVSRVEFLKMLYEAMGADEYSASEIVLPFSDIGEGYWYTPYVKLAYKNGVVQGYGDGTFKPGNPISFAEAEKVVTKAFLEENFTCDKCSQYPVVSCQDDWYWVYFCVSKNYNIDVSELTEKRPFPANIPLNRGEMAELIYRAKAVRDSEKSGVYSEFSENLVPETLLEANEFANMAVEVGDKIGGMEVTWVGAALEDQPRTQWNTAVGFIGQVTLSGTYNNYMEEDGMMQGTFCFDPDEASAALLPSPIEKRGMSKWFCFLNTDEVLAAFSGGNTSGKATVVIDSMVTVSAETEGSNTAQFIRLLSIDS